MEGAGGEATTDTYSNFMWKNVDMMLVSGLVVGLAYGTARESPALGSSHEQWSKLHEQGALARLGTTGVGLSHNLFPQEKSKKRRTNPLEKISFNSVYGAHEPAIPNI